MTTVVNLPVSISADRERVALPADLTVPPDATGVIVFAHGSGTSRNSPHNRLVAANLQEAHLATLLIDLLDEHEMRDRHNVFDEELIAERLMLASRWLADQPSTRSLALGYFGAGTGAGAALIAAAREPHRVAAVVSRGGRPDLAQSWLHHVRAPTLLIVGELDDTALDCNKDAHRCIQAEKELTVVPGAKHLFEEPGTLEAAAEHARSWFVRHLTRGDGNHVARQGTFPARLQDVPATHGTPGRRFG